ncbi:MAG: glycoside hydrolase family 127 protein [Planctomycetes bacterium]|nr:glycoside hydrolase family 127 protein [Planctomycetota bacterium]
MKRIKLNIEEPGGIDRLSWPITQGIPFPDKDLERGAPVRVVDRKGNILPVQSACLATWDKDLRYVKWLLLDFQIDLKAHEISEVFVEYGRDVVESVQPQQPLRVDRKNENIIISTGSLILELQEKCNFLKSCKIKAREEEREIFKSFPGPFHYMVGSLFDTAKSSTSIITIEESGPLRACICVKGYHATHDGIRFSPFILRIHTYAGKSDLRFYHTFIFDQDPNQVELSAIGIKFPFDLGYDLRMAFGGENKPYFAEKWKEALFLQTSDIDYSVTLDGCSLGNGSRTHGWASLSGPKGSVIVALPDIWKEYPKGISMSKDGMIDIQIWPADYKKNLVFWTPFKEEAIILSASEYLEIVVNRNEESFRRILQKHPTAPLNLKSFGIQNEENLKWVEAMIEKYAPERVVSYNDTGTSDGTGAAKTTEFVLKFSSEVISDDEAETFGISVQEPVIAPPEPSYTCATGVIGPFYHKGDPRFTEIDKGLDDIVKLYIIEPRDRCHLYGMMRYGNMVCSHSPAPGVAYRYYYKKDPNKALRYVGPYNNEANDQIYSVWGNFIRSGEREHFLIALAYSQCVADVAICHTHPSNPRVVGLIHYHSAHEWSGNHSPSHTLITGLLLHYYFTGNRRLLEVSLEVADWVIRWQEPCGIISNRDGALHREFTGPLWCLMEAYKATWETKYEDLARRSLNWFLKTQSKPGTFPISVYTRGERGNEAWVEPTDEPAVHQAAGGIYEIFRDGMRFFPSRLLKKTIIAEADHIIWNTPTSNYFTKEMAEKWLTNRSKLWPVDNKWYWTQWAGTFHGGTLHLLMFQANVVCLAYKITGNPIYVAYAKYIVEEWFPDMAERLRNFCPCSFTSIGLTVSIPVMMAIISEAIEKDPDNVEKAEGEWRRERTELGHPIYDGPYPGIPIDQKHFDACANVIGLPPVSLGLKEPQPRPEARCLGIIEYDAEN